MKNLPSLNLAGTKVADGGSNNLKKELPNIRILC